MIFFVCISCLRTSCIHWLVFVIDFNFTGTAGADNRWCVHWLVCTSWFWGSSFRCAIWSVGSWMCSFLLLFLLLIIAFTHLQDFAQSAVGNLETQGSKAKSFCKEAVVFAQKGQNIPDICIAHQSQEYLFQTSLQGHCFFEQDFARDSRKDVCRRGIPVGLSVWQTQQEKCQPVCPMLGPLVQRHEARCHSEAQDVWSRHQLAQQLGWMGSELGKMGARLGRYRECGRILAFLKRSPSPADRVLPQEQAQRKRKGQNERQRQDQKRANHQPLWCGKGWARAIACLACLDQSGSGFFAIPECSIEQEQYHAGDGYTFTSGIQGYRSSCRCSGIPGEGREGIQQEQHQILAGCDQKPGSCTESTEGCCQRKERPSPPVDQACGRRYQDLGGSTGGLQSSSGHPFRSCSQSKSGNRNLKTDLEGSQREYGERRKSFYPSTNPGGNRRCYLGQSCGRRGAEAARPTPRSTQCMCGFLGYSSRSSRTAGSGGFRRRQRTRSSQQATSFRGASEVCFCGAEAVKLGRGSAVFANAAHEAGPHMFPTCHSVTGERNYLSPIAAVWDAWKLWGEVISQGFEGCSDHTMLHQCVHHPHTMSLKSVLRISQEPQSVRRMKRVHFDDCIEVASSTESGCSLYSTFVTHGVLHEWSEKPWHYRPKPPSRQFSWRKLTDLTYPFCDFTDESQQALSNDESNEFSCHGLRSTCEGAVQPSIMIECPLDDTSHACKRGIPNKGRKDLCSSVLCEITNTTSDGLIVTEGSRCAPLSDMAALSSLPRQQGDFSSRVPLDRTVVQAFPEDKENQDVISAVQVGRPAPYALKNSPIDLQQAYRMHTRQEGQNQNIDGADDFSGDEGEGFEGFSPGDSVGSDVTRSSAVHPDRQDVFLFHLDDQPIRSYLNWNSYEEMMTEIAYPLQSEEGGGCWSIWSCCFTSRHW